MTKRYINRRSPPNNIDDMSLKDAITHLQILADRFGEDADIDFTCNYDGDRDFTVKWISEETDTEYEWRISNDVRQQEYRRQQYEALKREFEK